MLSQSVSGMLFAVTVCAHCTYAMLRRLLRAPEPELAGQVRYPCATQFLYAQGTLQALEGYGRELLGPLLELRAWAAYFGADRQAAPNSCLVATAIQPTLCCTLQSCMPCCTLHSSG